MAISKDLTAISWGSKQLSVTWVLAVSFLSNFFLRWCEEGIYNLSNSLIAILSCIYSRQIPSWEWRMRASLDGAVFLKVLCDDCCKHLSHKIRNRNTTLKKTINNCMARGFARVVRSYRNLVRKEQVKMSYLFLLRGSPLPSHSKLMLLSSRRV